MSSDQERRLSEPPPSLVPPKDSLPPPADDSVESEEHGLSVPPPPLSMLATDADRPAVSLRAPSKLPPMPEVGPILEEAAKFRSLKEWDNELYAYKRAIFELPAEATIVKDSIYACVAEVKRAQGKPREAETNYEKALTINPKHLRSIDGLIRLATKSKEWDRLVLARRRRVDALEDDDEKASELCLIADLEERRLKSIESATATLEAASQLRPDDVGIWLKLRDCYTLTKEWQKLVDCLDHLVRISTQARHRGSFRFAQADVVLGRLREEPRGLAFLEMALDEDPQCDRALSALVAVRTRREEWPELASIYERLIDRYAGLGDRDRAWEVCRKLGILRRDRLLDGPGALEAMSGAVQLRPDDAESRAALAELYAAKGERAKAARELEIAATHAPLRAQTYRRLYELHQRAQRPDRAWLAATCLEELGASDVAQELVIEQFRPEGPIRPMTGVNAKWWQELISADGADVLVDEIMATIGEPAIALRIEELEAAKKLPALDPAKKLEKGSTASVVRTFVWAARALGISLPDLYMLSDVPSGVAAIPHATRATALGPSVTSGRNVQALAFLAGRHLTYYRPEHYPLIFFPTLSEVSSLVLNALRLVIPGISVPPPNDGGSKVNAELGAKLSADQKKRLSEVVTRLDARGGKLDLFAWIRSVELTAQRAGLLLSGDLRVAMRLVKEETRTIAELTPDDKRADLLAYCASDRYAQLRERMGVAIQPAAKAPEPDEEEA
jgi:tetratricopeptide (TPR) repeat protein